MINRALKFLNLALELLDSRFVTLHFFSVLLLNLFLAFLRILLTLGCLLEHLVDQSLDFFV